MANSCCRLPKCSLTFPSPCSRASISLLPNSAARPKWGVRLWTYRLQTMKSRLVLMAGFGGLLLLMTFAGVDMLGTLAGIQSSNDSIREDFLRRTNLLERIRSDLYVSGTYVRDYLLEPEAGKAEGHRFSLLETKQDMDMGLAEYRRLLTPQEAHTYQRLTQELASYWKVLEPVFQWGPEKRQRDGFPFLRDEVFPRRTTMLGIADQ